MKSRDKINTLVLSLVVFAGAPNAHALEGAVTDLNSRPAARVIISAGASVTTSSDGDLIVDANVLRVSADGTDSARYHLDEVFQINGRLFALGYRADDAARAELLLSLELRRDPRGGGGLYAGVTTLGAVAIAGSVALLDHALGAGNLIHAVAGSCLALAGSLAARVGVAGWWDAICDRSPSSAVTTASAQFVRPAAIERGPDGQVRTVYLYATPLNERHRVLSLKSLCESNLWPAGLTTE